MANPAYSLDFSPIANVGNQMMDIAKETREAAYQGEKMKGMQQQAAMNEITLKKMQYEEGQRQEEEKRGNTVRSVNDYIKSKGLDPDTAEYMMNLVKSEGMGETMPSGDLGIKQKNIDPLIQKVHGDIQIHLDLDNLGLADTQKKIGALEQAAKDPKLKDDDKQKIAEQLRGLTNRKGVLEASIIGLDKTLKAKQMEERNKVGIEAQKETAAQTLQTQKDTAAMEREQVKEKATAGVEATKETAADKRAREANASREKAAGIKAAATQVEKPLSRKDILGMKKDKLNYIQKGMKTFSESNPLKKPTTEEQDAERGRLGQEFDSGMGNEPPKVSTGKRSIKTLTDYFNGAKTKDAAIVLIKKAQQQGWTVDELKQAEKEAKWAW